MKTKINPKGETFTYIYDIHKRFIEESIGERVLKE